MDMAEKHYLTPLFDPRAVGIIGASERHDSLGGMVLRNMLKAEFKGKLFPINPKYQTVEKLPCYPSVEDVPQRLDLVVITTRAAGTPTIVDACGRAGVKAVVVLSSGFSETGPRGAALERTLLETARRYGIRLLGPNCMGVIRPQIGLNATFAHTNAVKGNLGLISQSGALCSAVLDWALPNKIGFSSVVSLGSSGDIDFGEVLEYMISDPRTESIFLYVEGVRDARRFMSALRGAARVKPVLLLKIGRHPNVMNAVFSHSASKPGNDDVFDAALRRAGVVRLSSMEQLYAAASALFSHFQPANNHLAIITNGGGPGLMAADRAADLGVPLAGFTSETKAKLKAVLPPNCVIDNPLDILGDATQTRYQEALKIILDTPNVDAALVMLSPQASIDPVAVAKDVAELSKNQDKPVFTTWMGEETVNEGRKVLKAAGIPVFRTPEPAVELFNYISTYYCNQKLLVQTPASLSELNPPSIESARLVIETALNERRRVLNAMESKAILAAFRIPIAQTVIARSATEAMVLAEEIGLPVVMKIDSPTVVNKADSGGVRLNIGNLATVRSAYQDILENVKKSIPDLEINGVAIEPMVLKRNGRELMISVRQDAIFGPFITFGEGGNRTDLTRDQVVALPPLNTYLVQDLIRSAHVAYQLGKFRNMPAINMQALEFALQRVSEMVCELPWIQKLDINPIIVDENGLVAVDARIWIENVSPAAGRYYHMAIHPYPSHLIRTWTLPDGQDVILRPIKPEDAEMTGEFVRNLSPETKYLRYMNTMREMPPAMIARLTQIDYNREIAFVATVKPEGKEMEVGVSRYSVNPDGETCEFAIVVADAWQHRGLARQLMTTLIENARNSGLKAMTGIFLSNNDRMLKFVQNLGFVLNNDPEDNTLKHGTLALQD